MNINIATVLFTYNRSWHTNKVINALSKNTVLPKKLYIFQDGLKKEEHRIEWEKVNGLVQKVDFCPVELHILDKNIGVAQSIASGVNYVLERHDAIIVLEDDCVPSESFGRYMEQCLEKYRDDKRVWSIGGCSVPVKLDKDEYDVYGCRRTCSSGWGTWKDRWEKFSFDDNVLKRMKGDENKSRLLAAWGNDCERMMLENMAGRLDAWDIYWDLLMLENNGICINPYESLIDNIGWDGSGVHCRACDGSKYKVEVFHGIKSEFILPDDIRVRQTTEAAFADLCGSYTAIHEEDGHKENVIVYGLGNFFSRYEKEMNERYFIRAFIDRRNKGWYAGKKIISISETAQYDYSKILIMIQDLQECINVARELLNHKIRAEQIILGHGIYGKYGEKLKGISVLPDGRLLLSFAGASVTVSSKEEFDRVYGIFVNQIYNYDINNGKKDIILDVGMHIGAAALYFLNRNNVEKVYGYEPIKENFQRAGENLKGYLDDSGKIEIFTYGFGNEEGEDKKEERTEMEEAWEKLSAVIRQHRDCNIVLRLDCEDKTGCLGKLSDKGILEEIMAVMMQSHDKEKEGIMKLLKDNGFSCYSADGGSGIGVIYAYRNGKKGGADAERIKE